MEILERYSDRKPRVVKLNNREQQASGLFEHLLNCGHGITPAVARVRTVHPDLSDDFYNWLSQ